MTTNKSGGLVTQTSSTSLLLTNKVYDVLNRLVLVILPALATFYFALSTIWGLPYGEQVVGTITALALFLGAFVKLSNRAYNESDAKYDGEVLVTGIPEQPHSLTFNVPLSEMENQPQITLKVVSSP